MADQPRLPLNDGRAIPQLGLGVYQTPHDETAQVVRTAIEAGYRSIDTAAAYGNEAGVGEGVRSSGVPRENLFVTTKLWNVSHGYDRAMRACEKSLGRLGLDYLDLYLIHWPAPFQDLYVDTWKAFVSLRDEGKVRSIGVSNFEPEHIERIVGETGVVPAINQIEMHPRYQRRDRRALHDRLGIVTEAWSPLDEGRALTLPPVLDAARKHGRSPAQAVIRWHLDCGVAVIPKSVKPERIRENFAALDFRLDAADMAAIAALDSPDGRSGPHWTDRL